VHEPPDRPDPPPDADASLVLTQELLRRAKAGDADALGALMTRYLPRLQRWAAGRLPLYARSLFDTADLVQETLLQTLRGLDGIEVRGPGGFQAYVRQAVLNRIRDQIRWARRRPEGEGLEGLETRTPSPIESAVGADLLDRYERALATLRESDRQLLHLRIELDFDYDEIMAMTGQPSTDAVRVSVRRALDRLAEAMRIER
jgi:RNA polymerase sigma-70 factor (ECF subfamily)